MSRNTVMKTQKNPDGKRGHQERSKIKRIKFQKKKKFTGGPLKYEPPEINCPVYVPGCQPYQCPCKRKAKYDARVTEGWSEV